jgi:L-2-hydroxyglutarate oxidase
MNGTRHDIAIIGGGIVGVATAHALTAAGISVLLLEAEDRLAAHQTGHNSGVIHSGLYYQPGSLKARNCTVGREVLYRFCVEHGIRHERCGKIVVATRERDLPVLDELERRGRANGLQGLERLTPEAIREREPHAAGIAGLWVPQTGIVDYVAVTEALADRVRQQGGEVLTGARVRGVRSGGDHFVLQTAAGDYPCRFLINCAGLHSDRVARLCRVDPGVRIIPFRGEYYDLAPERRGLVRGLIYPVPDPTLPFLGVHFTRRIDGTVEAGPNAVLAFKREGYRKNSVALRDAAETLLYPGFWRMALRFWRAGIGEYYRSWSGRGFMHALQRLLPEITRQDFAPGGAGVRAQAVDHAGRLVDDFRVIEMGRMVHVLNAPSPAATASLSIGEQIARMALRRLQAL